jgi:hypothetical protein
VFRAFDGSVCCKNFPELLLRHRDVKVPDKNVGHEFILPLIFLNVSQLETEAEISKGDLDRDRLFAKSYGLIVAVRSLLASP